MHHCERSYSQPIDFICSHDTVFPIKYVHVLICCGYLIWASWIYMLWLPIFFRVASLALGQSYYCPSSSEVTRKYMDKALSPKAWHSMSLGHVFLACKPSVYDAPMILIGHRYYISSIETLFSMSPDNSLTSPVHTIRTLRACHRVISKLAVITLK